jgi:hypothetical protein
MPSGTMPMTPSEPWLSVEDAAKRYGVEQASAFRWQVDKWDDTGHAKADGEVHT